MVLTLPVCYCTFLICESFKHAYHIVSLFVSTDMWHPRVFVVLVVVCLFVVAFGLLVVVFCCFLFCALGVVVVIV